MKTEKVLKKNAIKAYKAFNSDLTCRDFQYEVGKTYTHNGNVEICRSGFHACERLADCFSYYCLTAKTRVAEVLLWGDIMRSDEDQKVCASNIKIVRELSYQEVLVRCNSGNGNTGCCNSGNGNSGDWNSGSYNTGNLNAGVYNTGYCNTGWRNGGAFNSGCYNNGDYNSGNCNLGSWNKGD